jgi:hypothetical protein
MTYTDTKYWQPKAEELTKQINFFKQNLNRLTYNNPQQTNNLEKGYWQNLTVNLEKELIWWTSEHAKLQQAEHINRKSGLKIKLKFSIPIRVLVGELGWWEGSFWEVYLDDRKKFHSYFFECLGKKFLGKTIDISFLTNTIPTPIAGPLRVIPSPSRTQNPLPNTNSSHSPQTTNKNNIIQNNSQISTPLFNQPPQSTPTPEKPVANSQQQNLPILVMKRNQLTNSPLL